MEDHETKKHLERIEKSVEHLDKSTTGLWRIFRNGLFYGAGYVVGGIIILALVGWILNVVGVIPAFANQVNDFKNAIEAAKQTTH